MSSNERAIIADAQFVVDGGRGDGLRRAAYAFYVAAMLLLTYGVTVVRALFLTQDPVWLRSVLLSWTAALATVVLATFGLVVVWRTGRARGPVVPPLPWLDLVAAGPVDRAIALRRWWVVSVAAVVTGAAMLGAVFGAGVWLASVGGPAWPLLGAGFATAYGGALVLGWLAGQSSLGVPGSVNPAWRPRASIRLLRLEDLRTQAARSTRMGGAVLLADLRAIRLEVAAPVTRGRDRRLRPGRSWTVIPRRDLLGMARQPGMALLAAAVTALGSAALTWGLLNPAVPVIVAVAGGFILHLGFATAAEGLRLQGDNAGTPSLLGLSARAQAIGHLGAPLLVSGAAAMLASALTALGVGAGAAATLSAAGWIMLMVLVVSGSSMAAAFRGSAPLSALLPEAGPVALVLWVSRQALVAAAAVGGLSASAAHLSLQEALLPAVLVALAAGTWGLRRVDAVTMEHRV